MKISVRLLLPLFILSFALGIPKAYGADNLISNPSFETANGINPASWARGVWGTNSAVFTYPVAGRTGTKAGSLTLSGYSSGDAKWYFNDVTVTPNTEYTFSDWSNGTVPSIVVARYKNTAGVYSYVQLGTVPAGASWKQFQKNFIVPAGIVSMTVFHLLGQNGTLVVDDYSLSLKTGTTPPPPNPNSFSQGMVTFSFDDGFMNTYQNGIPLLNTAGIKSTQAIITREFGSPGYVTATEVKAMALSGHEIASHTQTHPDLTTLSTANAKTEIDGSRTDLANIGINAKTFVYPYGEFNASVVQQVKDAGYTGARGVQSGYNTPQTNAWELKDQHLTSDVTFATVKSWIDTAVANKQWVILEMHQQVKNGGQYSNNPALLKRIIDYIKANNVKTVTLGEGVALLNK